MSFSGRLGGPVAALVLTIILFTPSVGTAASWSLLTGPRYAAGADPSGLTLADYDNDGVPDIIAVNHHNGGSISYLAGKGDATFDKRRVHKLAHDPVAIESADLNGDGDMDIVMANWDDGSISVMLGRGDKTFDDPVDSANGGQLKPINIEVADFDGDGLLDVVASNMESASISVFYGDGAWTSPVTPVVFGLDPDYALRSTARGLTVADFDGDGLPDVACTNWDAGVVHFLKNDGSRSAAAFTEVIGPLATGSKPWTVEAADFNGDGNQDVAVSNTADDTLNVYLGNGAFDGFTATTPAYSYKTLEGPSDVKAVLLNNDRYLDLVVANALNNSVTIYLGVGDGAFGSSGSFYTTLYPASIVCGDFDNDLLTDIAVGAFTSGSVSLFKGALHIEGDWRFGNMTSTYPAGLSPGYMKTGDFDLDLAPDLIAAEPGGGANLLPGDGHGALGASTPYTSPVHLPSCGPAADLNGDIRLDFAEVVFDTESTAGAVSVQIRQTDGSLGAAVEYPVGNGPTCVAAVDLNKDGFKDLVSTDTGDGVNPGSISILINVGDGTFQTSVPYFTGPSPENAVYADLNGDGYPEAIVPNRVDGGPDRVTVMYNDRGAGFGSSAHLEVGESPGMPLVFDLDRDGRPDIAVPNSADGTVTLLMNDGKGNFPDSGKVTLAAGPAPVHVAACDLDMNGLVDIAAGNSGNDTVTVFLSEEKSTLTANVATSGVADDPAGGGTDAVSGVYDTGTDFSITATPNPGYAFTGWSGNYKGRANPLAVSLHGDKTVTANFAPGPYVTDITPGDGIMGDTVTITGMNFGSAGRIRVGRKKVRPITWSDTSITFEVPSKVPHGVQTMYIESRDFDPSGTTAFEVRRAAITGISPASGVRGDTVAITGDDFGTGRLRVSFYSAEGRKRGARPLPDPVPTNTSVSVTVPKLPPGDYTVVVRNGHGESLPIPFAVDPVP